MIMSAWHKCNVLLLLSMMILAEGAAFLGHGSISAAAWKKDFRVNWCPNMGNLHVLQALQCQDFTDSQRRSLFQQVPSLFLSLAATGLSSSAADATEVRGPIELLRPAVRVRNYIEEAIETCHYLKQQNSSTVDSLNPLVELFGQEPSSFMTPEEEKLSKRYLEIDTSSAWQIARLKEREARGAELGIDYTTPYDRFNTAIQQWGDKTQFQILRSRQRNMEKSNGLRAAFNAYTNNLVFGDNYQLNVDGSERKNLIRNDALPDVNAVVVSDLDLRDLYRNQVLEGYDNAKAELQYQAVSGEVDVDEILVYLTAAKEACIEWFKLIPAQDVETASKAVLAEGFNTH